eukprot:COSAG02_NODE_10463_length_1936_cov_101.572482_3_plen_36_part_01
MAGFFYCVGDMTAQGIECANHARANGGVLKCTWAYD